MGRNEAGDECAKLVEGFGAVEERWCEDSQWVNRVVAVGPMGRVNMKLMCRCWVDLTADVVICSYLSRKGASPPVPDTH